MAILGYARVSSAGQSVDIQYAALEAAGCEIIRSEKVSGTTTEGRSELKTLLEFCRAGDTLVVTRIDRLARSLSDLSNIIDLLKSKNVTLKALEQNIDTGSAAGLAFLQMLGIFAEFETNLRKDRQLEGIKKAKALGVYKGRKKNIDEDKIFQMINAGIGASEISKQLGISRASVYRLSGMRIGKAVRELQFNRASHLIYENTITKG